MKEITNTNRTSIMATMAARFGVPESEMLATLKATAFKGQVSDAQMTALLIVANQYGLNPWTKEIYAFPDKNNGIVPVVGVDGWSRIINEHSMFDGLDFDQNDESCTCRIYRKDRSHPIAVTEYMSECKRDMGPWKSHPKRMLRHKSLIQCARLAFGYVGIFDEDEADRIVEAKNMGNAVVIDRAEKEAPNLENYPQDKFDAMFPKWEDLIISGKKTPEQIIAMISTKAVLSADQKSKIEKALPVRTQAADDFLNELNEGKQ